MTNLNQATRQTVINPFNGELVGTYPLLSEDQVQNSIQKLAKYKRNLSLHQISKCLNILADTILNKKDQYARLITSESGLCLNDTLHEVSRAVNVIRFSSESALRLDNYSESENFTVGENHYSAKSLETSWYCCLYYTFQSPA